MNLIKFIKCVLFCSWDRTPQISSIAQLLLDPFYRTIDGFKILVEKEWLAFGHKFGDRVGHGVGSDDTNERCPVFLQWIDCVHQIHHQFPCSFEFSKSFLIKLAQHVHSCLFGTFLCNTLRERIENSIPDRTFSVWPFLSAVIYKNPLYQPNREKVIWPSHNLRNLVFWNDFYLGSFHTPHAKCNLEISNATVFTENSLMKTTRSFDDLVSEGKNKDSLVRRLSDPSIVFGDKNMPLTVSIFQENPTSCGNHNYNNNTNHHLNNIEDKNFVETIHSINENGNASTTSTTTPAENTLNFVLNGDNDKNVNGDKNEKEEENSGEKEKKKEVGNKESVEDFKENLTNSECCNGNIKNNNGIDIDDENASVKSQLTIKDSDNLTIEEKREQNETDDSNKDEIDGRKVSFLLFHTYSILFFSFPVCLILKVIERDTRLNEFNVRGVITIDNLEQHLKKTKMINHNNNYPMFNGHKLNGSDTKSKKERLLLANCLLK